VIEHCDKALQINGRNLKALCRIGIAQMYRDRWSDSESSFKRALALDPNNKTAKKNLKKLRARVSKQNNKDRKKFGKVFKKGLGGERTRTTSAKGSKPMSDTAAWDKLKTDDAEDDAERKKQRIKEIMLDPSLSADERATRAAAVAGLDKAKPATSGTPLWQQNFIKMLKDPNINRVERMHHINEFRKAHPEWFDKDGNARPPEQQSHEIMRDALKETVQSMHR